ncbi:MAG: dTDP-4-dehydrorhamnose 3,5-epimerase [Candidatus Omnitrophica bacterium]|nr:dTDP-4-dehydrorhamnose 3,5-epimerase [Candidatus Omnitrophota bacterium]
MKFTRLEIPDIILIEPEIKKDVRGAFAENYRKDIFAKQGIKEDFIQDNFSISRPGVLRGLHFQAPPRAQSKLVRVTHGKAWDVAVDIRKKSKTYGRFVAEILSGENQKMIYIPPGFAHGFLVLAGETQFLYKVSDYYSLPHDGGVLWNDPDLGIPWPKLAREYLLSEKDRQLPRLKDL